TVTPGESSSVLWRPPVTASSRVTVPVIDGTAVASKVLHAGFRFLQDRADGEHCVFEKSLLKSASGKYRLQINPARANEAWQGAKPITLGELTVASCDEAEYIPLPGTSRKDIVIATAADHWYRFDFDSP